MAHGEEALALPLQLDFHLAAFRRLDLKCNLIPARQMKVKTVDVIMTVEAAVNRLAQPKRIGLGVLVVRLHFKPRLRPALGAGQQLIVGFFTTEANMVATRQQAHVLQPQRLWIAAGLSASQEGRTLTGPM